MDCNLQMYSLPVILHDFCQCFLTASDTLFKSKYYLSFVRKTVRKDIQYKTSSRSAAEEIINFGKTHFRNGSEINGQYFITNADAGFLPCRIRFYTHYP